MIPMLKHILTPIAAVAIFLASGVTSVEAKRVKERADLSVSFELLPTAVQPTATRTAEIKLDRDSDGDETNFDFHVDGLIDGTYTVNAVTIAGELVEITEIAVAATPLDGTSTDDTGEETEGEIELPAGLDPLQIAAISVVDGTGLEVLRGDAVSSTTYWMFSANVKVTGPTTPIIPGEAVTSPTTGKGKKGSKMKKVHGHVIVHSLIIGDVEKKRKFLFNAHGAPADTVLTVNIDGIAAATVTSSRNGKVKLSSLDEGVQLAGISEITVTDSSGVVVMQAEF